MYRICNINPTKMSDDNILSKEEITQLLKEAVTVIQASTSNNHDTIYLLGNDNVSQWYRQQAGTIKNLTDNLASKSAGALVVGHVGDGPSFDSSLAMETTTPKSVKGKAKMEVTRVGLSTDPTLEAPASDLKPEKAEKGKKLEETSPSPLPDISSSATTVSSPQNPKDIAMSKNKGAGTLAAMTSGFRRGVAALGDVLMTK